MAKKLKIPFNVDNDFVLIGIVSNMEDYRIAHFVNKRLNIELKKGIDFLFFDLKTNSDFAYSFYEFVDEIGFLEYVLLENKNNNALIINYFKNYDYFLIISGVVFKIDCSKITEIISGVPNIQVVKVLLNTNSSTIMKSGKIFEKINKLMSSIELHKIEIKSKK